MKVSKELTREIAKLARLEIPDDKLEEYTSNFTKILDYIDTLNKLNTENVSPTAYPSSLYNVKREDISTPEKFDKDSWKKNAPDTDGDYFRVPIVKEQS